MRTASPVASLALLLAAAPAPHPAWARARASAGVAAPVLNPGDSWTYQNANEVRGNTRTTHDTITLVRTDHDLIIVNINAAGATGPGREQILGPEWSRVRSVNGRQTTVNRPLAYPLAPGKTWAVDYTEFTPADRRHSREAWHTTYKVGPWEDVSVPAGTFHALRVDGEGTWSADLPANVVTARGRAPNGSDMAMATVQGARTVSGRTLKTFWYAPAVHRWVKSDEEIFDTNGARTSHQTADLEAYALADPQDADAAPDAREPDAAVPPRTKHAGKAHRPAVDAHASSAHAAPPVASVDPDEGAGPPSAPVPAAPPPAKRAPAPLLQELRWTVPARPAASTETGSMDATAVTGPPASPAARAGA